MSTPPDAKADDDGFDPNALLQRFGERLRELDQPVDLSISLDALQARRAAPAAPAPRSQLRPERWNMDDVTDVEDQSERRRAQASAELALQRAREAQAQRQRDAAAAAERRAVEAQTQRLCELAEAQARAALLAQQRAEREAALRLAAERAAAEQAAAERAAAEQAAALRRQQQHEAAERAQAQRAADAMAAELRLDFSAKLPAAAAEADLIASITLPRVPPAVDASLPELQLPAWTPAAPLDLDELGGLMRQLARDAAALAQPAQEPTLVDPPGR